MPGTAPKPSRNCANTRTLGPNALTERQPTRAQLGAYPGTTPSPPLQASRLGFLAAGRPGKRGAPERIRTSDLSLRRAALYPLSYGRLGGIIVA